jgi:hypothetical protein
MVYLKEDLSNPEKERFYFTDGANKVSMGYNFMTTVKRIKFLKSIGIEVNTDRCETDWSYYVK